MPKTGRKRSSTTKTALATNSSQTNIPIPKKASEAPSKQARVIEMLRSPEGATIAAMMSETDWQQHSVRGFLAGVVRKKLKLNLKSEKIDGSRVYRIAGLNSAKASRQRPKRSAA
jgi:hypothetical protein